MLLFDDALKEQEEQSSTLGHVSRVLGYLDRPRNAVATAVSQGMDEDPNKTAVGGFWKGLTGEKQTSWGDVFGIDRSDTTGKVNSFFLDLVGDPLNLIPIAKVPQAVKATAKYQGLADFLGGTGIAKAVGRGPGEHHEVYNTLKNALYTAIGKERQASDELYGAYAKAAEGVAPDLEPGIVRALWERPEKSEIDAVNFPWSIPSKSRNLPENLHDALTAQHGRSRELLDRGNTASTGLELETKLPVAETFGPYTPRLLTETGAERLTGKSRSPLGVGPIKSREMKLLADPEALEQGKLVPLTKINEAGENVPFVTKPEFLKQTEGGFKYGDKAVGITEASLEDIYRSGAVPRGSFLEDAGLSYLADHYKKGTRVAYLEFMNKLKDQGLIRKIQEWTPLGEGERRLNIPGLGDYATQKVVANDLENMAAKFYSQDMTQGAFATALNSIFNNTAAGRVFKAATGTTIRNWLALSPGFHIGNFVSNIGLLYQAGMRPDQIPLRLAEAVAVQSGKGPDILKGITNANLFKEFEARDLVKSGWMGSESSNALQEALKRDRVGEVAGETVGSVVKAGGKVTKIGMAGGQYIEANARMAAAIDWLKKTAPDFATKAPEEQQILLDSAARYARDSLIDYNALTPTENLLKNVFPFWAWQRGIVGKTAETLMNRPERLARFGRALDTTLEPMAPEDKAIADQSIQEQSPITGTIFGKFNKSLQGQPQMFLSGRFLPQGQIEQLTNRPMETALSFLNPFLKGPGELAFNWNQFRERPIDRLSQGLPGSVINPLRGQPYELSTRKYFGYGLPNAYEYLIGLSPARTYVNMANEAGRQAGWWEDPYRAPQETLDAAGSVLTGMRLYPYDRQRYSARRDREWREQDQNIRSAWRFARVKGDESTAQYYMDLLREHQRSRMANRTGTPL